MFHATILSIFPQMFPGTLGFSLPYKAMKKGIWSYDVIDIRDFGIGPHKKVDEPQCGGIGGMVLRADVVGNAIEFLMKESQDPVDQIFYMSPRGKKLSQGIVKSIAALKRIVIICGRFEGMDERVLEEYGVSEISIGDFVLFGGEVAAMALLESCIRTLPGVLEDKSVVEEDSFGVELCGMLEYPLYTIPRHWKNKSVPEVLLSGNHEQIKSWKKEKSLEVTKKNRPELVS